MKVFAESVKMKKASDAKVELTGEKVFDWDRIPGSMLVSSFSQKTSLRFRLVRNMEYTIEISRYDTYEHPSAKKPQTTDWAANLWNSDWDSELMANTSLSIGDSADWDPRLTTFFPDPYGAVTTEGGISAGLKEFIEIAGDVNSFLGDIKKQLPHLRG